MSYEESNDYCKTLFHEHTFIEMVSKFCSDDQKDEKDEKEKEKAYTVYISLDKIGVMLAILTKLPLICHKDKNMSILMHEAMNSGEYHKKKAVEI